MSKEQGIEVVGKKGWDLTREEYEAEVARVSLLIKGIPWEVLSGSFDDEQEKAYFDELSREQAIGSGWDVN